MASRLGRIPPRSTATGTLALLTVAGPGAISCGIGPDPNHLRLTKADLLFHTISTAVEIWREADFFDESLG
jgi:hypothetical protein